MDMLSIANIKAHQDRPITPEGKFITLWQPNDSFIHCCIESRGCRYSRNAGACVMCDYGIGRNLTESELSFALYEQLLPKLTSNVDTLLFGSYGSIFDDTEISENCFNVLLSFLKECNVSTLIFETHCDSISLKKLNLIKQIVDENTDVIIEMGYESCDEFVLHKCLNKFLDLDKLYDAIQIVHGVGFSVSLNVFLGAPFCSVSDQFVTTRKSIIWALSHGADSIVLFPSNIKPFTLLYQLYEENFYEPVSQWLIPLLFNSFTEDVLCRISLSWFGDRKNFYENNEFPLIPPKDCKHCHSALFEFYREFMLEPTGKGRKILVNNFLSSRFECNCKINIESMLTQKATRYSEQEILNIINQFV